MKWLPIDWIVILLTLVISAVLIISIYDVIVDGQVVSDSRSKRITTLITSVIAIIAMYVGAQIQKGNDK